MRTAELTETLELPGLVCASCRRPMPRLRVCPMCMRPTDAPCLVIGGCRRCVAPLASEAA